MKIGLALGGGFARGIAHIGVLQALVAHRIPIDYVAGTSAGSLVGAMFCAGLDPWLLERVCEQLNWRALVRLKLRRDGLLDAEGLERFVLGNMGDLHFKDLKIPFVATATDLLTGTEVLLSSGRVSTAVRASCAFPGIFLPVRVGTHTLVDGGLVHPVPSTVVRGMGAEMVIGVELNRPGPSVKPLRNLLHIMLQSLALVQRPQVEKSLRDSDVTIQPPLHDFSAMELERVEDMVRSGRDAAEAAIPDVLSAMERVAADRKDLPSPE
ncbi:MAG TPA: patatin-like phospholipase family protein [Candidatus Sulfotelmatobacter sp.]|nr:patatin-like phospholipase family protein [Candidatus Sulfotelmatobacter sp.]